MQQQSEKLPVLLVDDEEGIRKVLGIYLADMGYNVHVAESGEHALSLLSDISPEIILTDIKMPGMDGLELLRLIKQKNPDKAEAAMHKHMVRVRRFAKIKPKTS